MSGTPSTAKGKPVEGLEQGDTVYVRHPEHGVAMVNVLAVGKDGFQGHDDTGQRVKVRNSEYLGHKTRLLHTYSLVDEGADGVVVERGDGQRRFLRGELPADSEGSNGTSKPAADDPLLAGLDDILGKALRPLAAPADWLLKAVAAATPRGGRPGSSQRRPAPKPAKRRAADKPKDKPQHKHGDPVRFQHEKVEGQGKIVGSGKDGVTVADETGREHMVRHDALLPPNAADKKAREPSEQTVELAEPLIVRLLEIVRDGKLSDEELATLAAKIIKAGPDITEADLQNLLPDRMRGKDASAV